MCDVGAPSKDKLLALVLCTRRASEGPSWTPGFWFRAGLQTPQEDREAASSEPVLASGPPKNASRAKCLLSLSGSRGPILKTELFSIHTPEPHPGWPPGPRRQPLVPDGPRRVGGTCRHRVSPSALEILNASFSLSLRHFPEFHELWASLPAAQNGHTPCALAHMGSPCRATLLRKRTFPLDSGPRDKNSVTLFLILSIDKLPWSWTSHR